MSDTTTNLAMPYILAAQAQKHVTHNEALAALDAIVQIAVASRNRAAPPVDPVEGERYLVAAGSTDDWTGQDGKLAAFQDGVWRYYTPRPGWNVWIEAENQFAVFDGNSWHQPMITSPFGAFTVPRTTEEELVLFGAATTAAIEIPNRAIVLAVSVYVAEAITGATAFEIGITGESSKFGGSLGTNVGDTNIGVIGPMAVYAPTPIILTSIGGDFASGTVHLVLHTIECGPSLI